MSGTKTFVNKSLTKDAEKQTTKLRARANSLLADEVFVDWAGDIMASVGFFGEGRELTAYQQGYRGAIVRIFEDLAERADDGDKFLARVFKEKIKGANKYV